LEMPHVYNGQLCRGNPHCELCCGNVWNYMCTSVPLPLFTHTHTYDVKSDGQILRTYTYVWFPLVPHWDVLSIAWKCSKYSLEMF